MNFEKWEGYRRFWRIKDLFLHFFFVFEENKGISFDIWQQKKILLFFCYLFSLFFSCKQRRYIRGGGTGGKQGKIGGEGQSGKKQGLGVKMGNIFKY